MSEIANRPRDIKIDGPFLWAEKGVMRLIRDAFDGTTYLDQAVATYATLCELSSDNQGPVFTARRRTISERSGVSLRRVTEILSMFKQSGILDWTQNRIPGSKELAPSSYILLGLGTKHTPSTPNPTPGTPCPRLGTDEKRDNCPVSEESLEQSPEKSPEEVGAKASHPTAKSDDEWIKDLKGSPAYKGTDIDTEHAKMTLWCQTHHKMPTRKRFLAWLNRIEKPLAAGNPRNAGIAIDPIAQGMRIAEIAARRKAARKAQPSVWELKQAEAAVDSAIADIERKAHEDAFGMQIRPEDKAEYSRLKTEKKRLRASIMAGVN